LPFGEAGNEYGDEENPAGPGKDKEVKTPGPQDQAFYAEITPPDYALTGRNDSITVCGLVSISRLFN
jgi:hypothetical protein